MYNNTIPKIPCLLHDN